MTEQLGGRGDFVDITLAKALIALLPTSLLLAGSASLFFKRRAVPCFLQLLGASGLVVVALTHVCEALHLLAWMNWGLEKSPGHYIDLASAIVGLTFFPIGYLISALARHSVDQPQI